MKAKDHQEAVQTILHKLIYQERLILPEMEGKFGGARNTVVSDIAKEITDGVKAYSEKG